MKPSLLPGRLLWLVVLVATADARAEIALAPRSLLDGKVEMLVPTSLTWNPFVTGDAHRLESVARLSWAASKDLDDWECGSRENKGPSEPG